MQGFIYWTALRSGSDTPLYYIVGEAFSQSCYNGDIKELNGADYASIVEKTKTIVKNTAYKGEMKMIGEYCTSDDLDEIIAFSDAVLKVTPKEIANNTVHDRTSYVCELISAVKGKKEKTGAYNRV